MYKILNNKIRRYWDSIAQNYDNYEAHSLWRIHSDAVNAALLNRWLPAGNICQILKTDLFDEAFGIGLYPFLKEKTQNIIGMDVSVLIVKAAKKNNKGIKWTNADIRSLPFKENSFDLIVSTSTLDHFQTRHEIMVSLRDIHRVLRIGGQLIITLDNLANPVIALRDILPFSLLNRSGLVPYYMGTTLGPGQLCRILEKSGFKVTELDAVMHCPRVLAVAMARILEKYAGTKTQKRFLRVLTAFEHLSRIPTRFLTGYFVAARAIKC